MPLFLTSLFVSSIFLTTLFLILLLISSLLQFREGMSCEEKVKGLYRRDREGKKGKVEKGAWEDKKGGEGMGWE